MSPELNVQKGRRRNRTVNTIGLRLSRTETSADLLGLPYTSIYTARTASSGNNFEAVAKALEPLIGEDNAKRFSEALEKGDEGASITFKAVMVKVTDEIETYKVVQSKNL